MSLNEDEDRPAMSDVSKVGDDGMGRLRRGFYRRARAWTASVSDGARCADRRTGGCGRAMCGYAFRRARGAV